MYNVLTSFNKHYWDEVASQTVKKLDENWYPGGKIYLYHELNDEDLAKAKQGLSERVEWFDLYKTVPYLSEFKEAYKDHPKANGNGKSEWRTHAIKWVHKTFPLLFHVNKQDVGWLFWLDADAECFKKIDNNFLNKICNRKKIVCFLDRPTSYSECGFLGFNLNHPETRNFVDTWWSIYTSGEFTKNSETHDSFLFDAVRKKYNRNKLFDNLNAGTTTDKNPFGYSKIGSHFLHVKGQNKKQQLAKAKRRK